MENNHQDGIKLTTPVAIILAGALIMLGIIISQNPKKTLLEKLNPDTNSEVATTININPVSEKDHVRGDLRTAQAVFVEFSDTECPWCKVLHPILKKVIEERAGKVAWVYRQAPIETLHEKSRNEARATECVAQLKGNDAFWQYLDIIYERTPSNDGLDPGLLVAFAEEIGVDKNSFNKCMIDDQARLDKLIDESLTDARKAGLEGTPYSIIIAKDGTKIPVSGVARTGEEERLNAIFDSILK